MIKCSACGNFYESPSLVCTACEAEPTYCDGFISWSSDLAYGGGGFKADYFEVLAKLEGLNFWFKSRNLLIVWALRKYSQNFSNLLEIGCGTGFVLSGISRAFPSANLTGSEIFVEGLPFAKKRTPGASFVQLDARNSPYSSEFDVVSAFDVIEHIEEDAEVLTNMFRAVRPGGSLIVTVPQHRWLWSQADEYACHVRRYSKKQLHKLVEQAGFEIIRSTSFVSLLLPLMMMSRLRQKHEVKFDPVSEFKISPLVNTLLGAVLSIERWIIKAGLNLSFGGSRLIVARKKNQ